MFAQAVAVVSTAKPHEIFSELHKLYTQITKMKADEVIAAYQTLQICAHVNNSVQNPIVMSVMDALKEHMQHLKDERPFSDDAKRFNRVAGI